MPAPVASGWSDRRVGLAPTENAPLLTAHVEAGALTRDQAGNACASHTAVATPLPIGAALPNVVEENTVITLIKYDPMTGTGDEFYTGYVGGACNGATFANAGATQVSSGKLHFVVTDDGSRLMASSRWLPVPQGCFRLAASPQP
jgi:hypothetical protein